MDPRRRARPRQSLMVIALLCGLAWVPLALAGEDSKAEFETSSPGPSVLTPAEVAKLARLPELGFPMPKLSPAAAALAFELAGKQELSTPTRFPVTPLPSRLWDAQPTPPSDAAVCSYTDIVNRQVWLIFNNSFFRFDQPFVYWNAIGTRTLTTSDWDISSFNTTAPDPTCVTGLLATSSRFTGIDFVVGDYNHSPLGTDYASVTRFSGSDGTLVQYDGGQDIIGVNGLTHRTVNTTDVVEIWDTFFTAGTGYTLYLDDGGTGSADLRLFVFRNPAAAPYYAGRNANAHEQGMGYDYYGAGPEDWYGIAVTNENGGAGQYDLVIKDCSGPFALPYETSVELGPPGDVFAVNQAAGGWAAAAVRGAPGASWSAQVYEPGIGVNWPACWGTLVADDPGPFTRIVLGDFRYNPPGVYYPAGVKTPRSGFGGAHIEWDDGRNTLVVNDPPALRAPDPSDVIELWNVELEAGTEYTFEFHPSGEADYHLLLYGHPVGPVWLTRTYRFFDTQATTTYTPAFSGTYAVAVVNDNAGPGNYSVAVTTGSTAVPPAGSPTATRLLGANPNPARGEVRIDFELREPAQVELAVVDVAGRRVAAMAPRTWPTGTWSERWAGRDAAGRQVPAGVYWIEMSAGGREISRQKVMIIR